jgi:hypothetical protein
MTVKHILNQSLKRLEPIDKQCYYCLENDSVSMNDNYFIPIFKEQDRTNIVVYSSVKYSKVMIGIPRCTRCKAVHDAAKTKANIYAWLGAVVFIVLSFMIFGVNGMFAILPAIFIGFGGAHFLQKKIISDNGILGTKEGAEQNATIQEFIIAGWSFTQPSA